MAKRHVKWSDMSIKRFVVKARAKLKKYLADVHNLHVTIMDGNNKTGRNCFTVSLLPIIDCCNCSECKNHCYDVQHDVINDGCLHQRLINSAIHKADPERYWREIEEQVKVLFVTELRINVGGDLTNEDFEFINEMGKRNPNCDFLFFTKNYDGCNEWLDNHDGKFVSNVHPIYSRWPGMEMKNPYHIPESHVLFPDGTTTAPEFGAYFCGGNCSYCHFHKEGCWVLKNGEHVIFEAH